MWPTIHLVALIYIVRKQTRLATLTYHIGKNMATRPAPLNKRQRAFNGLNAVITIFGPKASRDNVISALKKSSVTTVTGEMELDKNSTIIKIERQPAWGNNTSDIRRQMEKAIEKSPGANFALNNCVRTDVVYRDDLRSIIYDEVRAAADKIAKDSDLKIANLTIEWE